MRKLRSITMALAQAKKDGPYPKNEKKQRREEVYRLHFDYGYSGRKIAGFLKINRSTIRGDIDYWIVKIVDKWHSKNPVIFVMNQIERFEVQRTRLRKQIDNAESFQEKMTIERFILNIDLKIASFQLKLVEARINVSKQVIDAVNKERTKHGGEYRPCSRDIFFEVSKEAQKKIVKIVEEDAKNNQLIDG